MEQVTDLPFGRDGGHRCEHINGALIVTPAPTVLHQRVSMNLAVLLSAARTELLDVLAAPLDVELNEDTIVQPDLLVSRRGEFEETNLPMAPMLAVEIASPGTQLVDLTLKKALYEEAGAESYWVVDPSVPRLVAWELQDGAFVQVAHVAGEEAWTAQLPFTVTIVPAALVD